MVIGLACIVGLSACASAGPRQAADSVTVTATRSSTAAASTSAPGACPGAVLTSVQTELPATGGRAWVWFQGPMPAHAGRPIKVVWKFDGTTANGQSFGLQLHLPGLASVASVSGDLHQGSSWTMGSGVEWGSYFAFPQAACWQVTAHDAQVQANVAVDVRP